MDQRPIGFFDSGLGGLTCIPHFRRRLPDEGIIYYGDTARTPYGSKAVSTIQLFAGQITDFLVQKNVKMIVIPCNTVSATSVGFLQARHPDVPVVGIIEPAVDKVIRTCQAGSRVGVIGTKVTIDSDVHSRLIHARNPQISVFSKACPLFVPIVEEGVRDDDILDPVIRYYLDDLVLGRELDTLVLGCTHYPILRPNIERIYPELDIIDPSEEIVNRIDQILSDRQLKHTVQQISDHEGSDGLPMEVNGFPGHDAERVSLFYASDLSSTFCDMIAEILQDHPYRIQFKSMETPI